MSRLKGLVRRHLVDALYERGFVEGVRVEVSPRQCRLARFQEPMPGAGQVLIETCFSVVSPGTERAYYLQLENVTEPYPIVMGYSQVGRVVAAGPDCAWALGTLLASAGPHASLYLAPAARAVPVPADLPPERAALMSIGVIAQQAVRKAGIIPGDRVLVMGAGLIGQLAGQLARIAGGEVTLAATSEPRLAVARACGLTRTLNVREQREQLQGVQADVVIEATGNPQAIEDAAAGAREGAQCVLLGSSRGVSRELPLSRWQQDGLALLGAHTRTLPVQDESPQAWTWHREAGTFLELSRTRLHLDALFTARVRPDEMTRVYAELARPDDKAVAVLIDWSSCQRQGTLPQRKSPLRQIVGLAYAAAGRSRTLPAVVRPARADGRRLRFGLVGCGEIAAESAAALRAASNASISFAVDPNLDLARDIALRSGARASSDLTALLESPDVDAVLISTPHHLHAPLAIQCLDAGKHVVVEKPMATTVAECDEMIAAAQKASRLLSVCYCYRLHPRVLRAKQVLESGAIGDLLATHIVWAQHRATEYWQHGLTGRTTTDWRAYRRTAGGGVLIMNACHMLDMMAWLVGRPVIEVTGCTATLAQPVEVEDMVSISYRYEGGAVGTLVATTALVGPEIHEQRLQGREGQLWIAPGFKVWSSGRWQPQTPFPRTEERRSFFEAFADAALDGTAAPVTAEEARRVQALIEGAYLSAERKQVVAVADLLEGRK